MSRYVIRENVNISLMLLIYGVFILFGSSFLSPPYILLFMCIIPIIILMVGAILINNPKGISRLKTYLRLQIFINGIFSIYNVFLIDRSFRFLFSSDRERFWRDNITFVIFVIACELTNLAILSVSIYNIRKMTQRYLRFVKDVRDVKTTYVHYQNEPDDIVEPLVQFSKTQVPPEWRSLYPDTAHDV